MLDAMRTMNLLEIGAYLSVVAVIVAGVVAWESNSHFGAQFRVQLRFIGWLLLGIPQALAGMIIGMGAMLLSPFSARINAYRLLRAHQPRHAYVYGMD